MTYVSDLVDAGNECLLRYLSLKDPSDLSMALKLLEQAEALVPPDSQDRVRLLSIYGVALRNRFVHTGDIADLERAIAVLEEAIDLTSPGSPRLATPLHNLGNALCDRYHSKGALADLDRAIECFERGAEVLSHRTSSRTRLLSGLGMGLRNRHSHTGDPDDLERAITILEQVVDLTPPDSFDLALRLNNLGNALCSRYLLRGNIDNLERALASFERAVNLTPRERHERALWLSNLGAGLRLLYKQTGNLTDLERAIARCAEAVELTQSGSLEQIDYLNNLGAAWTDHYLYTNAASDLDRAILCFEQAVSLSHPETTAATESLSNLAAGFMNRYRRTGDLADLRYAAEIFRQAADYVPVGTPSHAAFLNNCGISQSKIWAHTGDMTCLRQAVMCHEQVVKLTPVDSPDYSSRLSNLAAVVCELYWITGVLSDFERAIVYIEKAIAFATRSSAQIPAYCNNLGCFLHGRYERVGNLADLDQAIMNFERALALMPTTSQDHSEFLTNLASALGDRYAHVGNPDDLERSIANYRQSCTQDDMQNPMTALRRSQNWINQAWKRVAWSEIVEAFGHGNGALEQILEAQLTRTSREAWLSEAQGLHTRVAYALIFSGNIQEAVMTLEAGRARLLAEAQERARHDLSRLPVMGFTDLIQRFQSIVERLDQLERIQRLELTSSASTSAADEMRGVRTKLHEAISEIRCIPGFEDFYQAPTFEQIQRISAFSGDASACVYLCATTLGGLALIVSSGGVTELRLRFTTEDLSSWLLTNDSENLIGGYLPAQLGFITVRATFEGIIPALGEKIMQPLATVLKGLSVSVVTLIPTGHLALLPLHAARYTVNGQTRTFIDDFTVAYAPSAQALGHGQTALANSAQSTPTLFAVGNPLPLPQGASPLVFAQLEIYESALLFGNHAHVIHFEAQATRAAVEQGLSQATYLHFSCHGQFNVDDPLGSGILLSNGERLTVRDLNAGQRLKNARLAVLSACQTAITDFNKLPEEAVGLPSGFLQAGVPGVVGTLWPVNDLSTALLMIKFYRLYQIECEKSPLCSQEPAIV